MVNNTVNGKKIGKAAGKEDKIKIGYISTRQGTKNLTVDSSRIIPFEIEKVSESADYVAVKAYVGGNPNKVRNEAR